MRFDEFPRLESCSVETESSTNLRFFDAEASTALSPRFYKQPLVRYQILVYSAAISTYNETISTLLKHRSSIDASHNLRLIGVV